MKVVLFFAGNSDPLREAMFGRYIGGGMLFVGESEIDAYFSKEGEEFSKHAFTNESISKWISVGILTEFLMLSVDEEETRKMLELCQACVKTHKQFNVQDVLLMLLPFRNPDEIPIYETKTLNNTQAIILILRECLNKENPLRLGLEGLHSRTTFMDHLYDRLAPFALPVLWSKLVKLVKGPA